MLHHKQYGIRSLRKKKIRIANHRSKASGGCENCDSFGGFYICHGQDKCKSKNGVLGQINGPTKMFMS